MNETVVVVVEDLETVGSVKIVRIEGAVDRASIRALDEVFDSVLSSARRVVVDCSRVSYINSTGLIAFLRHSLRAKEADIRFQIILKKDSPVYKVFDVAGIVRLLEIHETREEAEETSGGQ